MGSKTPKIQAPTQVVQQQAPPRKEDKAVQDVVGETVRRRARGRGYRSTILSRDFLSTESAALSNTLGG